VESLIILQNGPANQRKRPKEKFITAQDLVLKRREAENTSSRRATLYRFLGDYPELDEGVKLILFHSARPTPWSI